MVRLRVSALLFYWFYDLVTNHVSGLKLAMRTLLLLSKKRPKPNRLKQKRLQWFKKLKCEGVIAPGAAEPRGSTGGIWCFPYLSTVFTLRQAISS